MVHERQNPADSLLAEQLWDAIFVARAGQDGSAVDGLEKEALTFYEPMARSVAHVVCGESALDIQDTEREAAAALAQAVIAWRHPTSSGFRRFARSVIIRQLSAR